MPEILTKTYEFAFYCIYYHTIHDKLKTDYLFQENSIEIHSTCFNHPENTKWFRKSTKSHLGVFCFS